jgi:short-subunit dehydrogenase
MCILCLGFLLAVIAYLLRFLYQKYRKISFAGKTILITGASSGIGEEYALQLSQYKDTTLILVSNELDKLQEVKAKCAYPENVHIYYIDLSNIKDTQETCQIIGGILIS